MPDRIRAILGSHLEMLFQGRITEMLPRFDLPLAVQIGAELTVLSTPQLFVDALSGHRAALLASGVTGLSGRLTAVELPRRGRFRIWADIDHHRCKGVDMGADQFIAYCREEPDGFRVELLHCTRLALLVEAPAARARLA